MKGHRLWIIRQERRPAKYRLDRKQKYSTQENGISLIDYFHDQDIFFITKQPANFFSNILYRIRFSIKMRGLLNHHSKTQVH